MLGTWNPGWERIWNRNALLILPLEIDFHEIFSENSHGSSAILKLPVAFFTAYWVKKSLAVYSLKAPDNVLHIFLSLYSKKSRKFIDFPFCLVILQYNLWLNIPQYLN